jgi:hypothetical protein
MVSEGRPAAMPRSLDPQGGAMVALVRGAIEALAEHAVHLVIREQ